jgi:hypothetical protein
MTPAEREVWRSAYAAAFVTEAANMARHLGTSIGAALDKDGMRYAFAEAARRAADEAVEGLRETEAHHHTKLSKEALR